jgi:hypothetical protein
MSVHLSIKRLATLLPTAHAVVRPQAALIVAWIYELRCPRSIPNISQRPRLFKCAQAQLGPIR